MLILLRGEKRLGFAESCFAASRPHPVRYALIVNAYNIFDIVRPVRATPGPGLLASLP